MNFDGVVRAVARAGEIITLRRLTGTARVAFDVQCQAAVSVGTEVVLVGSAQQTGDRIMVTDREIVAARWPGPPRHGDQVIYADKRVTTVQGRAEVYQLGGDMVFVLRTTGG